ncbi:unnamed protein product [Didymodactylos carnosus]|uniref:Uncharacterized protein n=1 Tax=Didymodactylos carnosus TaxID=1234261 RepID=A0A814DR56_9BILA|nr:unnamed protein product [Didymodactylos carnosus]CAF1012610.1 unnamed protein product [Didymodactylos carnosus]CAF3732881.1 unnamed protein product [Didymodactylos carnosus]CAF3781460.1 unnamed protein product [Didymodactylos carnosus]
MHAKSSSNRLPKDAAIGDTEFKKTLFEEYNPDVKISDVHVNGLPKSSEKSKGFLSFKKKSEKPKKEAAQRLKVFEIHKFADVIDILLMFLGTLACLGTGATFPLMMLVYQSVTNGLVDLGIEQNTNSTTANSFNALVSQIQGTIKWYVILGFTSIALYWIGFSFWMIAAERQLRRIRFRLFRSILHQEIAWFDVRNAGELSNRLVDDLDKIQDGLGDKVADLISLVSRLIGGMIFAFVIVAFTIKEVQAYSSASAVAQEVFGAIRTVTAFSGQKKEEVRFAKNLTNAKSIGIKKGFYLGLCQAFAGIAIYIAFTVTFWYGPHLVRTEKSNYSAGTVIVIFVSCLQSTFSISQLVPNIQAIAEASGSGSFVFDLIARKSKIDAFKNDGHKPSVLTGNIELRNVKFTYPSRPEALVLNNINIKIPSGNTVALVGASGCGSECQPNLTHEEIFDFLICVESTIIQLIQRFYDPDSGEVLLDGRDIRSLNVAWLRTHIGIVSQEPVLFTGSIEDNIRFGKQDATDEEVIAAAKMANAHDFIMELPDNYKTSSGDKLSGGQKQRVAIARALISNPRILLLDEATSALDNTSERVVQDALDKAKEGRTTIVIAHRLSTIRNADLIISLERGQMVEFGTHNELLEKKGLYYELATAQTEKQKNLEEDSSDDEAEEEKMLMALRDDVHRARTLTATSIKSGLSDASLHEDSSYNTHQNNKSSISRKCSGKPFIFKILELNKPEWFYILIGAIGSIVVGAVTPAFALLFSNIYGLFAEQDVGKAEIETRNNALLIFSVGVVSGIGQFVSSVAFAKSGEELTMRMRILSFASILRQEIAWFDYDENSTGALITRLSSDASGLKGLSGLRIGVILNAVGAVIMALSIAFAASWKLTLIILLFVPLMIFSGILQGQRMAQKKSDSGKNNGNSWPEQGGLYATQAIDNIRTVIALHQEDYFIQKYEHCFNNQFKQTMWRLQLHALGTGLANSLMFFIHSAAFGYGVVLIKNEGLEFSLVFRVFSVITFGAMSVGRSTAMVPDYAKGKASAERILALNKRRSKINPEDPSGIKLDKVTGDINFKNVRFHYPARPKLRILKGFNLFSYAGQTLAIVGPSGSGKSTCVSLILRFYDPLSGSVHLDGHDVKSLNLTWLRSLIGLVQQEPVLFNLTIRENIAYGDNSRDVSDQEIESAARKANIHESITSLPQGYDTLCGSKGSQLSGGQKQRIAIARSLIRDPKILLLDEATSALDTKSEKVVQEALDTARLGRTCMTIAHRLSTIRNSDKIVVVDKGCIREEGSHDELLAKHGIYWKLSMAQERPNE